MMRTLKRIWAAGILGVMFVVSGPVQSESAQAISGATDCRIPAKTKMSAKNVRSFGMEVGEMAKNRIEVYAHRGARSFAPENSIPGYAAGLRIGTDWVDMDIVLSKEGEIMVTHDIWLNPDIVRYSPIENGKQVAIDVASGAFLANGKKAVTRGLSGAALSKRIQPLLVRNLSVDELRNFDVGRLNPENSYGKYFPDQIEVDGTRMPTLREVINYVKKATGEKASRTISRVCDRVHGKRDEAFSDAPEVGFQIEIKTDPDHRDWTYSPQRIATALYKILREEGLTRRCEIQAFDWPCLYELQKLDPGIKTAYLTEWDNEIATGSESFFDPDPKNAGRWTGGKQVKDFGGSIPRMVKELGGACWEPEDAELTKEALDEAHGLGLKVVVWTWPEHIGTAFDAKLMSKLIDWGVDGIITDDPGRLISMLAARGYPLPRRYDVK
ncbi:MAG: glycerophosphodiester phosphodiesterase family protein [Candidatus Ozemobacteraceae bacterium]